MTVYSFFFWFGFYFIFKNKQTISNNHFLALLADYFLFPFFLLLSDIKALRDFGAVSCDLASGCHFENLHLQ